MPRPTRWRLGLLLVSLLAACTPAPGPTSGSATSPASAPPLTASAPARTPTPTLRLRTPLPPPSADPIERVLTYERSTDIPRISTPELLVMADGRVLAPDGRDGLSLRRLSPAGVDLIRRTALDTGIFTTTRQLPRQPLPGASINLNRGFAFVHITVRDAGRDVTLTAQARDGEDALYRPDPVRDTFLALADRLADLSWLPASAWADPNARPYVASVHRLYVQTAGNLNDCPSAPASNCTSPLVTVPVGEVWPFTVDPGQFGAAVATDPNLPANHAARCALLSADDARVLGEAMARTTGDYRPERRLTSGDYRWPAGKGEVHLQLEPLLPDAAPSCDGVRYFP